MDSPPFAASPDRLMVADTATQATLLLRLHRHDDGFISFAVAQDDEWRPVFAIRADQLETMFPEMRAQLFRDSFVSINAAHRAARGATSRLSPGMGRPRHRTETLRYLCACYCDLDFYKHGFTYPQALAELRRSVEKGRVPPFSFLVNSGRGLWAFWLLHDEHDPGHAHTGAFSDNPTNHLLLYQRIHREIGHRLAWLGADPAATDAARYVRMPGSFRNDLESNVVWEWPEGPRRFTVSYGLRELAGHLELKPAAARTTGAKAKPAGTCPARRRGFAAANQNKLAAVRHLLALRGGLSEGYRNTAAFILAACLRGSGMPSRDTLVEVEGLARACIPPLPLHECLAVVKSVYKKRSARMSYRYIADQFGVTPEEAQSISDQLGKPFPAANASGTMISDNTRENGSPRAIRCMLRRLMLRDLVEELGVVPSCRRLQCMLQERGIKAGYVTVMADLRALEFSSERLPNALLRAL